MAGWPTGSQSFITGTFPRTDVTTTARCGCWARYQLRCLDDPRAWLVEQCDWVDLGAADEQKAAKNGTVEAWGRSADNPVGGWYGLRKGYRGRFGMYVPPLLEALGKAELTHDPRNNKVRALT